MFDPLRIVWKQQARSLLPIRASCFRNITPRVEHKSRELSITCVIGSLGLGGAQRNMLRLVDALGAVGHAVTLLTLDPETADFFKVPGGVRRQRANPAAFWGQWWGNIPAHLYRLRMLRKSILDTQPDLVISFIDTTNISVLIAMRNTKVPVIVSERTDPRYHPIGARWRLLRRWAYRSADRVVLVTKETQSWARTFLPPNKFAVVHNPVMEPGIRAVQNADAMLITAMGRLGWVKGFDLLITAFASIAWKYPEWKLKIIGEGEERARLGALIKKNEMEERIELVGALKDPFTLLAESAFFVFSSRYEGFPMALAEAMAMGLPVISFDCPSGPRELVRPGVDGLLVRAGDSESLAAAMSQLIDDRALRERMGKRAGEICSRFPLSLFTKRWIGLINEVACEQA